MLTEEELIQIRRHLHQIPELALQEFDTHQYLVETVASFNQSFLEVRTFKELPTALMVLVHGQNPQRTIGYRTDIDALPVEEQTGLSYSSIHPGVMHACGHEITLVNTSRKIISCFSSNRPKKAKMVESRHMNWACLVESGNQMSFTVCMIILICQRERLAVGWEPCLREPRKLILTSMVRAVMRHIPKMLMIRSLRQPH